VRILQGHQKTVRCVGYSADSRWLASGSDDGTVCLWDLAAGGKLAATLAHGPGIERLAFHPQLPVLTTGTASGVLTQWSIETAERQAEAAGHTDAVRGIAYSANGHWLASVCWGNRVRLADAASLSARATINRETAPVVGLVFLSVWRTLVLACSDGRLVFYDVASREQFNTLTGALLLCVAASRDDRYLAAGNAHGQLTVWDTRDKRQLRTLEGHKGPLYSLAFAPDGRTLLTGGADGTVRVWDAPTGRERTRFRWHQQWVTCVAVAPDGMTAAAGSEDHTVVVWDTGQIVGATCPH
jgi:WD40 repeat protein